ncbi:hypothetical protein [Spiroplasma endosymbiont of Danaus chrysippus]|nr:hypothetical protein [Spiroplasma endosymbiont of Danaus chrysippus]
MIIYKCDYCQKSIMDGNWIRNYQKIFWFKKNKMIYAPNLLYSIWKWRIK